ncbi:hypothetical protein LJR220_002773 [Bradyrhizobium sp. LjRoot220]|uniref:hypothetical protein n=1 Tax=Bradyrhizobium sp. LjRoot220 TaxID=3342284 RepID=UPI003ECC77FA
MRRFARSTSQEYKTGTNPEGVFVKDRAAALVLQLAGFYSVFSGAIALALWLIRQPLGGPGSAVFLYYWLQASALMGTIWVVARYRLSMPYLFGFVGTLLGFLGLQAVPLAPWLPAVPAFAVTVLAGAAIVRSEYSLRICIAAAASMLLAAGYFLHVNSFVTGNVLSPERTLAGMALPDPLFHASISAIMVWYGKVASALDGLQAFRYHVFSHLWLGLDAKATGIDVLNGYVIGKQVVGLPLLLFGLGFATLGFVSSQRAAPPLGMLVVVPIAVLFIVDRFDAMSYLVSESHMFGLLLLLIGLPFLRSFTDDQSLFPVVTAGLYGLLLSAAKISIGMIWTVAVIYVVLSSRNIPKRCWVVLAALLALQAWIIVGFTLPGDNVGTTTFGFLHFLVTYPMWALANLVPIGLAGFFHLQDIRRGGGTWPKMVLLMMLLAVGPALTLRIEGGSAYYFLNVGTWIAIASLSGRIIDWAGDRAFSVMVTSLTAIAICVVAHPGKNTSYATLIAQRNALYARLDPSDASRIAALGLFDRGALAALAAKSAESTGAKIGRLFRDVHASAGDNLLVSVAPEFSSFWTLTPICEAAPFLIPAAFGLPLLHGLPPLAEKCQFGAYYGYALYGAASRATGGIDDANLCRLTRQRGFAEVVVLRSENDVRRLKCD